MKSRYKNINEEVERIKTLFTEERLYGNTIDSQPELLTEQIKSLRNIWDDVAKSILKNSNEFRFKAPKGMEGNPRVRVVKERGGDIKWYRGNKEIKPTVKNLVSTPTLREIQSRMNKILTVTDLEKFLNGEDFYKIYDDIFKDLKAQEILDNSSANNLLSTFKNQNLGNKIYDDLLGSNSDNFMNGVYSMSDLKSVHPGFAEMIDDIPYFEQKLKNILKKGNDFYDDDAVTLARYFSGDNQFTGEITAEIIDNQNLLKLTLDNKSSLLDNPSIKNNPRVKIEINPNNSNEYILSVDLKKFNKKDMDLLKSNLPNNPTISGTPTKTTRSGLEDYIDDYDDLSNLTTQKTKISDEILRKSKSRNSDVIGSKTGRFVDSAKKGIKWFLNNDSFPVLDTLRDAWSKKFRKDFNVNKWKKTGRGNNTSLDLQLSDIQKQYVDDLYITDIPSRQSKSPFIEKGDTDLLGKGYKEGMIHPNAKIKPNWKSELYKTMKIIKWNKAFWSVNKDYRSWAKTLGRLSKNAVLFTPGPWGIPIVNIYTFLAGGVVRMGMSNTINKILENNGIIKLIATMYRVDCVNNLSSNIKNNKMLSEKTKGLLLGEVDENNGTVSGALSDVFRSVGGIGNLNQSITGTPPKYSALDTTNVDDDFFTWLDVISEDNREIDESKLTYTVKNLVGKDIGGPAWEITKNKNGDVGVVITVDGNGDLCGEDTSGCKRLFFTLECVKFSEFYNNFMDKTDIREVLLELGWDAVFAAVTGGGIKPAILQKTKEIYEEITDKAMNFSGAEALDKVKEKVEDAEEYIDDVRNAKSSDPEEESILKKY